MQKSFLAAIRVRVVWPAVAGLPLTTGCGTSTTVEVTPKAVEIAHRPAANLERSYASTASPLNPAGNEQTLAFLAWAHEQHPLYCYMQLDANGDCVKLDIDICWDTQDAELKKVSELKQIESLALYGPSITDQGLQYLEEMPALKSFRLIGAAGVSEIGLERLKRTRPGLTILLPGRKET